jgi:microcystin-dependent protein
MKSNIGSKFLFVLVGLMFLTIMPFAGHAAVPEKINYQGYLTNSSGAAVTGSVQMVFSIYNVDTGGTALWTETQTVTVTNGIYNVVLGATTPITLAFDTQYYLGVKVGTDSEMTPRRPLTSVGYALRAKVADSVNNTASIIPYGMVVAFAGTTAPSGWLICDGSAVSRTTYASLFAAIGTVHGSGDGSTTFNLPDYRGRFLRGVDETAGNDPDKTSRTAMNSGGNTGDNVGSVQNDAYASHNHRKGTESIIQEFYYVPNPTPTNFYVAANGPGTTTDNSSPTGSSGGNETRPVNAYVNWIIKY